MATEDLVLTSPRPDFRHMLTVFGFAEVALVSILVFTHPSSVVGVLLWIGTVIVAIMCCLVIRLWLAPSRGSLHLSAEGFDQRKESRAATRTTFTPWAEVRHFEARSLPGPGGHQCVAVTFREHYEFPKDSTFVWGRLPDGVKRLAVGNYGLSADELAHVMNQHLRSAH